MFNNLFRAVGSKVDRPFASSRRLYMVVNRRDRTVKVRSRRSNQTCEFSWALPTDLSARGLNGLTDFCAQRASRLLSGDATPEKRYELERDVARRIWLEG